MPSDAAPRCPTCGLEIIEPEGRCPRCAGDAARTWDLRAGPGAAAPPPASRIPRGSLALDPDRRYEELGLLGRGAMGQVFEVRDRELDELIAIKVLDPLFGSARAQVDEFKNELRIARRINHPNVARLYDLFEWRGRLAISQELIRGRSLEQVLAAGPLPLASVRRYLRFLCSALHTAHQLGVVHRDLKPANIMIDEEDRPRILDFGLALLAGVSGARQGLLGTPRYMAPEQALAGAPVDHRADLYSLGVVLYRMLTGTLPFTGDVAELLHAHLERAPEPPRRRRPDLPAALDAVVLTCLEKVPTRRFPGARALYQALERALGGEEATPPPGPPPVAPARERKALVIDDDDAVRESVAELLEALGVRPLQARGGEEGIELAARERPDFILLDLNMPGLSGQETLFILKSRPETAGIAVVILTGESDPVHAHVAKGFGAAVYLNKPVQADVLELLVEKYTA